MKTALFKDTLREIKISVGRFISIFAIVALGCGFFAGIKATMPDMVDSANSYFEDNRLMDYKLVSTFGVSSDEIEEIKKLDTVEGACGGYSKEIFYNYEQQNHVLKAISYSQAAEDNPNRMNLPVLVEGRFPTQPGECLIEKKISAPQSFKIGNTLTFSDTEPGKELTDSLEHSEYKIVGICASPMYIGYKRDNTKAGNGSILCNIYLPESEFLSGYYTECYVRFKNVHSMDQFSDEYRDKINELKDPLTDLFTKCVDKHYKTQRGRAEREVEFAKNRIESMKVLLSFDKAKLLEFAKTLQTQQTQIEGSDSIFKEADLASVKQQIEMVNGLLQELEGKQNGTRQDLTRQLEQAQQAVQQGEQQLEKLKQPEIYGFDRFEASSDYSSFCGDANKIDSISKVFPVFFILIAFLVCLTTMTRMVDEHRIRIGTYKALGYSTASTASKYLVYGAVAAIAGSCIGTAAGLQIFPRIIYSCYKILYNMPSINTPFKPWYMFMCCFVSLLCICGAVLYSCMKALRSQPSQLMRPKAPQNGRRVLLERMGFVWKRLSFLSKVTVRNLLRYKKRFFMTLVGVAGCTALIITGFGLKHSISDIVDKQFNEILLYDATLVMNNISYDQKQLDNKLSSISQIKSYTMTLVNDGVAEHKARKADISLVVADKYEQIHDYLDLSSVDGKGRVDIPQQGCIITKKMSSLLNIKKGDDITISLEDEKQITLEVKGIVENYAMHYVYITPRQYEDLYGKTPGYNMAYVNLKEGSNEDDFKKEVISCGEFYGLSLMSEAGKDFLTSLDSLDAVVILLIVCAGLLAIVVLYNLANINITERVREIATIKVLGFYDLETSKYIYRENIVSAVLGIIMGFGAGIVLHHFVVITAEVDIVLFNHSLVWWAYALGAVFTAVFTVIVNFILHFKLKRIDMVESMKSVE